MGINYTVVQDSIIHANRMNNKKTENCLIWKFIKH